MALPCTNQDKFWNDKERAVYRQILDQADRVIYISREYTANCMYARNRYMVEHSDYCICYSKRQKGGTAYTITYANSRNLPVLNLAHY